MEDGENSEAGVAGLRAKIPDEIDRFDLEKLDFTKESFVRDVLWVGHRIDRHRIDKEEAPSEFAYNMWQHYSQPENRGNYWGLVVGRLMPSRTEVEKGKGVEESNDDQIINLIERLSKDLTSKFGIAKSRHD